jgi:uncharacterized protein DUF4258
MPDVTYSRHAEERLAQRRITKADVEWALRHPIDNPTPGQPGSVWIWGHAVGGRTLKVCVATSDRNRVITAVWP